MNPEKWIPVTEPFLPEFAQYVEYLRGIWERNQLTNNGPLVLELENRLCEELEIDRALLVCNGALGLHLSLKALDIRGAVVTTPFSYVATTSCLLWEGLKPVFADIDPETMTIDPDALQSAITTDAEAILATHVYGNPCDVMAIDRIARKHGLAVIYDAAHAFGVRYQGQSILRYGDLSMVSLHATKLFHTAEGGLIAGNHRGALDRIEWLRRFGHNGEGEFHGAGINAKLSELHAAMGLAILPHVSQLVRQRRAICATYDQLLDLHAGHLRRPSIRVGTDYNYAYYPVIFPTEGELLETAAALNSRQISCRRYFFPSLSLAFPNPANAETPIANDVARRVLCLPLSSVMATKDVERVVEAVCKVANP